MKTVIMAGGRGTRISALFPDIPKPLIPVMGKPVLEWELLSPEPVLSEAVLPGFFLSIPLPL